MGLCPPDQDLKTWMSPAGVLRGVKLDSRRRHQVGLSEHGEESEGEAHLQGRTEVHQAGSDGAEAMGQGVRMGRCHRGGVRMEMSAAQSKQDTWKDSRATGGSSSDHNTV